MPILRTTLTRTTLAVVMMSLTLSGCGTLTGIPAHGGGKRFATEQRLVSASIRAALKDIDVTSLKGKRAALVFDIVADEGGGNMAGGRINPGMLFSIGTMMSPVTSTTSAFQIFNLAEGGANYSNTSGGSSSNASTVTVTNGTGTNSGTSSGTNSGTSSGSGTNTSNGTSSGTNTNTGQVAVQIPTRVQTPAQAQIQPQPVVPPPQVALTKRAAARVVVPIQEQAVVLVLQRAQTATQAQVPIRALHLVQILALPAVQTATTARPPLAKAGVAATAAAPQAVTTTAAKH